MDNKELPKIERILEKLSISLLIFAVFLVIIGLILILFAANFDFVDKIAPRELVFQTGLVLSVVLGCEFIGLPSLVIFLIIQLDKRIRRSWNNKK